jgi:hypothetical protein
MDADLGAPAHGREHRRRGEDLRVRPDADLQVLRPQSLPHQQGLQLQRAIGARPHVGERAAEDLRHAPAHLGRGGQVALGPFLDHALEQAGRKGDARGLDHLQIAGREQLRRRGIAV